MLIRCCICDDTPEDIRMIRRYADAFSREHPEYPLHIETFENAYDLLEALRKRGGYDLYLLDVVMAHMNGLDIARKIRERGDAAEILFLSVSREYAVEAFEVKAAGYLVKPVKQADFERNFANCLQRLTQQENPSLLLKSKVGLRKLYIRQIVTIESFNHSRVCTLADGSTLETTDTLSSLYERLKKYPCFFLPHRAYVVNLSYVNGITATVLLMADGRSIPISRNVYPQLKEAYIRYTF